MLPPRWSSPAWVNIAVNAVAQVGSWLPTVPASPHAMSAPATAHSIPGWLSS